MIEGLLLVFNFQETTLFVEHFYKKLQTKVTYKVLKQFILTTPPERIRYSVSEKVTLDYPLPEMFSKKWIFRVSN